MGFSFDLKAAGWRFGLFYFVSAIGLASLLFGLVFFAIAQQSGLDALAAFFVGSAGFAAFAFFLPSVLALRQIRTLEWQVGSVLRVLSVRLAFEPFEQALCNAARQPSRPHIVLLRLALDLENGVSVLSALRRLGAATPSVLVKKAAMQLAFCYRNGDASALAALSDEFSNFHSAALQRFSGLTSFSSVWFEAFGALLPLFLSAYVLVGSSFLDFTFAPPLPFWALALFLPLLDGALVLYVFLSAPEGLA